mmetsp:Transcript_74973/g.160535  ORF Transcript_74973/g.160535 Transcript_74973/m.160535 type:complete len:83 (-) Transcript_74973:213-461(-)
MRRRGTIPNEPPEIWSILDVDKAVGEGEEGVQVGTEASGITTSHECTTGGEAMALAGTKGGADAEKDKLMDASNVDDTICDA